MGRGLGVRVHPHHTPYEGADKREVGIVAVTGADVDESVTGGGDLCHPAGKHVVLVVRRGQQAAANRQVVSPVRAGQRGQVMDRPR